MIAGGLDVHRTQITFDYLDIDSGESRRGVIRPATRESFRHWLADLAGTKGAFVLEATTGWRFVVEELRDAGFEPHLAEPAEARARKGPKRRAKTDRADARHLRDLLISEAVPESWIPPDHIADLRTKVRLRKALVGQRTAWQERIHAQLFHRGLPPVAALLTVEGRARLEAAPLPPCARDVVNIALRMIDSIDEEVDVLDAELIGFARHQAGCRALMSHYGIGAPHLGGHPRRVGRHSPVLKLPPGRSLRRARRHRVRVERQAVPRQAVPSGPAGAAVGAV